MSLSRLRLDRRDFSGKLIFGGVLLLFFTLCPYGDVWY